MSDNESITESINASISEYDSEEDYISVIMDDGDSDIEQTGSEDNEEMDSDSGYAVGRSEITDVDNEIEDPDYDPENDNSSSYDLDSECSDS